MATIDLTKYRTKLSDYVDKYENVKLVRKDGILEMTLHTNGDSMRWSRHLHAQLEELFLNIGRDRENKVVIMTGTGSEFSGPIPDPTQNKLLHKKTHDEVVELGWEVKNLLMNLLNIDVPMISAINGPVLRHAELPILCDIVLASETASFKDSAHFIGGLVPGDGMHIVMPMLMGTNRGRYFLLTGQVITAMEALNIGFVNEILPQDQVLDRAWSLARDILQQPELVRRYARTLLTEQLRRQMTELLSYGFSLEGLGMTYADST
jgi:enoyl-CoA hydratase/carnithine racemase